MTQVPPPSTQRCFSASKAQEKLDVTIEVKGSVGLKSEGSEEGWQDATVSMSTSFRMKNLGNVPPRLVTLDVAVC